MLTIFRKHTESWLIKVVFTVIILVFIFFFGYARMQKGRGKIGIAARVNGEVISYGRYKLAFESTREFYKNIFPNEVSEEMLNQIRSSALHQVINEALLEQLAKKFGISVTVKEVYDAISQNPNFQTDGVFDPYAYKNNFLPYFERRYGLNYENLLKHGILADKARNFLLSNVNVTESEGRVAFDKQRTKWTFERISIPESIPEDGKYDIEGELIAKQILEAISTGDKKTASQLIKKYKLTKEDLKDITIGTKHLLIPTDQDNDVFLALFSLTKDNPTLEKPIRSGTTWFVFKLTDVKRPSNEEWDKEKEEFMKAFKERKKQEYLMQWQEILKEKAKIEQYVLNAGK